MHHGQSSHVMSTRSALSTVRSILIGLINVVSHSREFSVEKTPCLGGPRLVACQRYPGRHNLLSNELCVVRRRAPHMQSINSPRYPWQ